MAKKSLTQNTTKGEIKARAHTEKGAATSADSTSATSEKTSKAKIGAPTKNGVPEGASFINHTTFTNALIKRASAMTVSTVLRVCYILFGVAMGLVVFVLRYLLLVDNLVTILVVCLGLMLVWQGYRLPIENARRIIAQLGDADDELRKRTMFATNKMFGIVLHDDSTFTFTWDKFNGWSANDDCITLSLRGQAVLIALDANGFVKGDKEGFLELLEKKIVPKKDNAFVAWTKRVCFKLDNWKDVKAKALKEEAEKKEAKQAAKDKKAAAKEAKQEAKAAKKK